MGVWTRFRGLSGRERLIVVHALIAIVAIRAGLRVLGFRRWHAVVSWMTASRERSRFRSALHAADSFPGAEAGASVRPSELSRLTNSTADSLFFHVTCLERSLALWWVLRWRGLNAELRLGARKNAARFEAHAWVEIDGVCLGDTGDGRDRFVAFGTVREPAALLAEDAP